MAAAVSARNWVGAETAHALSESLGDPPEVASRRREAGLRVGELPLEPNPLYRKYGYFSNVDLSEVDPLARGPRVPVPPLGARTVQIVHDADGTHVATSADLPHDRVRLATLPEIWAEGAASADGFYPESGAFADRLTALAAATINRGYRLHLDSGPGGPVRVQDITVLSRPSEALSVRRSIRLGPDVEAILTEETFATPDASASQRLFASDTRLDLAPRARAAFLTVHAPDLSTVAVYNRRGVLDAGSKLTWMWNGFGGHRTKVRNLSELPGRGAQIDDLQTFFGDKTQSYDSAIQMSHIGTDTHGQSITRGVFRDEARGMSRGLVRIEKDARATLSYLSEHAMLLSRGARSDTIPILEILCRDVKATHSSSVAPVDPEKVFYLESRGITADRAVRMIGEGFLAHVLDRSPLGNLRDLLYPHLARRWDGESIHWIDGAFPSLPALTQSGGDAGPDWRFDAKLR